MASEHTPTPWAIKTTDTTFRIVGPEEILVVSTSWHSRIRNPYPLKAEAEANAALIVRAVNRDALFDDVVKALEAVDESSVVIGAGEEAVSPAAMAKVRAAIAAVREGQPK